MASSLQTICVNFMKNSSMSGEYALAVRPSYIASEVSDTSLVFLTLQCTLRDGHFHRGVACGFLIPRQVFLLGTYEGCTCHEPENTTHWHGVIHIKDIVNVITSKQIVNMPPWDENKANEPASFITRRQRMYLHNTMACWIKEHNDLLHLVLTEEFLNEANSEPVSLSVLTLDYL